jgi:hypothetical protein
MAEASKRVIDQSLRNRIMEELLGLSAGDENVVSAGADEWFESFFDYFPYDGSEYSTCGAVSESEMLVLVPVVEAMQEALQDVPDDVTGEVLIASGWPTRIAPMAKLALEVLLTRGTFSEEIEEDEPSSPTDWPYT